MCIVFPNPYLEIRNNLRKKGIQISEFIEGKSKILFLEIFQSHKSGNAFIWGYCSYGSDLWDSISFWMKRRICRIRLLLLRSRRWTLLVYSEIHRVVRIRHVPRQPLMDSISTTSQSSYLESSLYQQVGLGNLEGGFLNREYLIVISYPWCDGGVGGTVKYRQ